MAYTVTNLFPGNLLRADVAGCYGKFHITWGKLYNEILSHINGYIFPCRFVAESNAYFPKFAALSWLSAYRKSFKA